MTRRPLSNRMCQVSILYISVAGSMRTVFIARAGDNVLSVSFLFHWLARGQGERTPSCSVALPLVLAAIILIPWAFKSLAVSRPSAP